MDDTAGEVHVAPAEAGQLTPAEAGLLGTDRALTASQAAQTAAIKTLAGLVGKGVDAAAVVAAVERAIESAVIDVNINTTPEA
ncbi:hypothetical protein ABT025_01160 [Streptomyces sp. NPDC002809]|uniref:hypothetical protein n=1 Tax=Streptomyces sp. NPDC002809 TaxID=3154433 RepID=UPI00331D858A